ncbi:MAG TPA: protein kinase [Noviherbaspirillum sp.]|nr:protein kinase [Noviherbaspirillum sp.]
MMNEYNEKTVVRTRRTPFRPSSDSGTEHGLNVLPIGTHLGEFEILDLIGEGGFGIVYLAYDHSLERHVALKEYMPSGLATRTTKMAVTVRSLHNVATFTAGLKSFINEARMLAQFDSPSLVKVHRFWEGNGTAYMVMPFYEGVTLKQAYKEHRITPSEAWIRVLLADLFDAIETIHNAQCLHRDIAPDNILLLKDGRPLLLDFGAARRVIGDLTQCLTVILKPGFAPIEQYADIAGLRQGPWTDIYALAAVVYYLVTGKAPPPAVARMVHDELVPARDAGKGRYSSAFLGVLDKALSVKPEQRYKSIAEIRRALDIMEAVPRTLPRSDSDWATTVARTAPLGEEKPSSRPEHAFRKPPRTRHEPQPQETTQWVPPGSNWHVPPDPARLQAYEKKSRKPAWLVLSLLLAAGVGAGVYLGTTSNWDKDLAFSERVAPTAPPPVAMAETNGQQTSGASEVPEVPEVPEDRVEEPLLPRSDAPSDIPSNTPLTAPAPVPTPTAPQLSAQAAPPAAPAPEAPSSSTVIAKQSTETSRQAPVTSSQAPVPKPARSPATAAAPERPAEDELWRLANKSDTSSAYENYLDKYPKGRYATEARLRLESRQPKIVMSAPEDVTAGNASASTSPRPGSAGNTSSGASTSEPSGAASGTDAPVPSVNDPSKDERELWKAATGINEPPAYEAYLNLYPDGRYAGIARERLARAKPPAPEGQTEQAAPQTPAASNPTPPQMAAVKPSSAPTSSDKQNSTPSEPASPKIEDTPKPATEAATTPPEPTVSSGGKKTLKLDDQTMVGNFSADPKTGIVSGTGKITWKNGNQFEGTLVRGIKEGKGKFIWANGQRYSGDWARDMPNGKGTIVFANGNRYEGDVKDGVPHGQGITRFKDGDIYSGAWVGGKTHGHGRYTWANGSYWEGEFRSDQRTANGKMVFADEAARAPSSGTSSGTPGTNDSGNSAAAKAALDK